MTAEEIVARLRWLEEMLKYLQRKPAPPKNPFTEAGQQQGQAMSDSKNKTKPCEFVRSASMYSKGMDGTASTPTGAQNMMA